MTATVTSAPGAASSHAGHARHFPVSTAELERIAHAVLDAAKRGGATAAETDVSQGIGQSVTVRKEAVETWPIVALTPKTTLDRKKIAAAIEDAAVCGYGLTQSQNILNEIGIAAPILAADGRPMATVQCSISSLKWSIERVRKEIAPHLIEVANSIHLTKRG